MANITKVLNGVVKLAPTGTQAYDFVVPNPNTLSTEVLSEVYIHCDSSLGRIIINLPNIASIGSYNAKVYVVDTAFRSSVNSITIAAKIGSIVPPLVPNTVNGVGFVEIRVDGTSKMLTIVSDTQWLSI